MNLSSLSYVCWILKQNAVERISALQFTPACLGPALNTELTWLWRVVTVSPNCRILFFSMLTGDELGSAEYCAVTELSSQGLLWNRCDRALVFSHNLYWLFLFSGFKVQTGGWEWDLNLLWTLAATSASFPFQIPEDNQLGGLSVSDLIVRLRLECFLAHG